jgi:hypothetical protein
LGQFDKFKTGNRPNAKQADRREYSGLLQVLVDIVGFEAQGGLPCSIVVGYHEKRKRNSAYYIKLLN